jgi:hypothetical protein
MATSFIIFFLSVFYSWASKDIKKSVFPIIEIPRAEQNNESTPFFETSGPLSSRGKKGCPKIL